MADQLAHAGGLLFFLTFCHFLMDWIPQTHKDAIAKSKDHLVRAGHVSLYTILMLAPILAVLWDKDPKVFFWYSAISVAVTWVTHFIGDTYIPVALWAKYIRKIPEFQDLKNPEPLKGMPTQEGVVVIILFIVLDQLWHITFLTVPVALAVWG